MHPFSSNLLKLIGLCLFVISTSVDASQIYIPSGKSAYEVCHDLKHYQLVRSKTLCRFIFKCSMKSHSIKAGLYDFSHNGSFFSIYKDLIMGNQVNLKWSVNERQSPKEMILNLRTHSWLNPETYFDTNNQKQMQSLQGLIYPDTYYYRAGDSEKTIVSRAQDRMNQVLNESWVNRSSHLLLKTPYEALILASLIEMETSSKEEKPMVSSVIHNRLRKNMYLQIDASVQFGLEKKDPISPKDITISTPYNTYKHKGLPPSPICFPGRDSIEAALHPAKTDFLYYVLGNDSKHIFSVTYEQHKAIIKGSSS